MTDKERILAAQLKAFDVAIRLVEQVALKLRARFPLEWVIAIFINVIAKAAFVETKSKEKARDMIADEVNKALEHMNKADIEP